MFFKNYEFYVIIAIIVVFLFIIWYKYKNPAIEIINESSQKTDFRPTYYEIYDSSTIDVCNRFVIMYPFRWYFYCLNNQLYVLDSESAYDCPTSLFPAIKVVPTTTLSVVCISVNKDDILQLYKDVAPIQKFYDLIGIEKFTVSDALNLLFENNVFPLKVQTEDNLALATTSHKLNINAPTSIHRTPLRRFVSKPTYSELKFSTSLITKNNALRKQKQAILDFDKPIINYVPNYKF